METSVIQLENISYVSSNRIILQNINLTIQLGHIISVIGPNGAGKSTLLKIVLGLQSPTSGQRIAKPGLKVGYMPQQLPMNALLPLKVIDFLRLVPHTSDLQIIALLEEFHIAHLTNAFVTVLSGGEWQRVLLLRALLNSPSLLVLDEPTQGMDLAGQAAFFALIARLRATRGCAVLMVTHDLHYVMAATDTVICLNGHVCCHGHPETVKNSPEFLALYHHEHDHRHDLRGGIVQS